MATRAYRRDNRGRFAGAGGGTKVTYGKAGGFANAAHRAKVAQGQKARPKKSLGATAGALGKRAVKRVAKDPQVVTSVIALSMLAASSSAKSNRLRKARGVPETRIARQLSSFPLGPATSRAIKP